MSWGQLKVIVLEFEAQEPPKKKVKEGKTYIIFLLDFHYMIHSYTSTKI